MRVRVFELLEQDLFATGVVLTEGGCVSLQRHPYAFILQALEGVVAGVVLVITRHLPEFPASKQADLGMLLTLVAGALNVLLIGDAFYRCGPVEPEGKKK